MLLFVLVGLSSLFPVSQLSWSESRCYAKSNNNFIRLPKIYQSGSQARKHMVGVFSFTSYRFFYLSIRENILQHFVIAPPPPPPPSQTAAAVWSSLSTTFPLPSTAQFSLLLPLLLLLYFVFHPSPSPFPLLTLSQCCTCAAAAAAAAIPLSFCLANTSALVVLSITLKVKESCCCWHWPCVASAQMNTHTHRPSEGLQRWMAECWSSAGRERNHLMELGGIVCRVDLWERRLILRLVFSSCCTQKWAELKSAHDLVVYAFCDYLKMYVLKFFREKLPCFKMFFKNTFYCQKGSDVQFLKLKNAQNVLYSNFFFRTINHVSCC